MQKVVHYISYIAIIVSILFIGIIFHFIYFPSKIIDYQKSPIPLAKTFYHPGDTVNFIVHYCKYKYLPGNHNIEILGGTILPDYSYTFNRPIGCGSLNFNIALLIVIKPGKYFLRDTVTYQVPFLIFAGKQVIYTIDTVPFIVQ